MEIIVYMGPTDGLVIVLKKDVPMKEKKLP
jgi:hypothetical protein